MNATDDTGLLDRPITLRGVMWAIVFVCTLPFSLPFVFPRFTLGLLGVFALAALLVLSALRGY